MVGFRKAASVAKGVDDGVDIERIGSVTDKSELVEKTERLVDIAVAGAEIVDGLAYGGGIVVRMRGVLKS